MVSSRSASVTLAPSNGLATSRREVVEGDNHATTANRMARGGGYHDAGNAEDCVANGRPGGSEWSHSGPPSLSMSVDLHNLVSSSANLQDSGHFSSSPERGGTATPKLQGVSHEEEESYEGFGSVDADPDDGIESHAGSSSTPSPTGGPNSLRNPRSPNSTIGRQTWLRTSLRRSQPGSGRKRLSSNALASQLYRSGSFNSLGRSVNCETTDDLYSDVSLEDDVIDLNQKPMNHPNPTCVPASRPGPSSSSTRPQDNTRVTSGHPTHQPEGHAPPYGYYPPFYPRFNPYDFYLSQYYPVPSHQPACCTTEPVAKSSGSSRYIAILLLLLIICSFACIGYRFIRDAQQEPRPRVITLTAPPSQVQMIQEKMDALVDTQSVGEERYARVKQENATLQARILMLEEAAKDAETRAEEKLQAEQRRYRELASRLEREKQLQLENCAIKMQANEMEKNTLRDEIARLREQLEKVRTEKSRLENDIAEVSRERDTSREGERQATSRANATLQMLEVAKDELSAALEDQQKHEELVQEIADLRARNKLLEESRDELQAALALQTGRELLMMNSSNNSEKGPSLAAELLAGMNQDQADGRIVSEDSGPASISELKQALKEQQEVNAQLRTYIDGILLNIVENYPQLLEVKQTH